MATKAELKAFLDKLGVEYPADATKQDLEDLEAKHAPAVNDDAVVDDEEPGLPGTPVDAVVPEEDYVPLGVAVDEPQFDAPEGEDAEAVDESEEPLEATPSETEVVDATEGSTRPEDGYVAE